MLLHLHHTCCHVIEASKEPVTPLPRHLVVFAKHEQRSTPSQKQSLVIATSPPAVTSTPTRKGLREECERAPTQRRAPVQRTAPFLGCSGIPTWRLITLLGIRYCSTFAIIRELLVKLGLQEKNWMMLVVLLYSRHFWHPTVCSSAFPSAFLHSIIWCSCTLPKRGGS